MGSSGSTLDANQQMPSMSRFSCLFTADAMIRSNRDGVGGSIRCSRYQTNAQSRMDRIIASSLPVALGLTLQPTQQRVGKRIELADALSGRVSRRYLTVGQILLYRVPGKSGSSCNLSYRQLVTSVPAPNNTQ